MYINVLPVSSLIIIYEFRIFTLLAAWDSVSVKAHFHSENFPQKENFVKCDWPTQIFRWKNFEVENFQLLTMIFSGNFLSVEIFLEWKWAFTSEQMVVYFPTKFMLVFAPKYNILFYENNFHYCTIVLLSETQLQIS